MWLKRDRERELRAILSKIETASAPSRDLVADVLRHACPRLGTSLKPSDFVQKLVEAEAWVELGLWLIGWELPDWSLHHLSCDDRRWNCLISLKGLAINWAADVVEFQHDNLALAILGALVEAQLLRVQEPMVSNVVVFRKPEADNKPLDPEPSHPDA